MGNVGVEGLVNSAKGQFRGMLEGEEVEASNIVQERAHQVKGPAKTKMQP